jgi:hypothetical protein
MRRPERRGVGLHVTERVLEVNEMQPSFGTPEAAGLQVDIEGPALPDALSGGSCRARTGTTRRCARERDPVLGGSRVFCSGTAGARDDLDSTRMVSNPHHGELRHVYVP